MPRRRSSATPHKSIPQINAGIAEKAHSSFFIDLIGIEQRIGMFHPFTVFPFYIETAAVTGVAGGRAVLPDLDDNGIGITVGQYFDHVLGVARFLALHPVLVAGPAEEPGFAVFERQVEGFLVHEGHHQYFAVFMVLDNGRDQAAHLVEIDLNHANYLKYVIVRKYMLSV